MMKRATGTFEVRLTPQADAADGQASVGRLLLDKRFQGDLEATGGGQMLTLTTRTEGSAGYVALEWVSGTLHGLSGGFALQHSGRMSRGVPELRVSVVPDSGSGELLGLEGEMSLDRADGQHSYTFAYTLKGDAAG